MKKILLLSLLNFLLTGILVAQDFQKSHSLGFQFSFIDFPTAQELRKNSVGDVIDMKGWQKTSRMEPAITFNYAHGISSHIDFMSRLTAAFIRYPFRDGSAIVNSDKFYFEADANLNVKLLTDRYIVVPYLQAGIGTASTQSTFMAQIPLGVGLQIKIDKNNFININSNYRIPVTARANHNLIHSIGVLSCIVNEKPKAKPLPPPPPPPQLPVDGDADGVVDSLDLCPEIAGLAEFKGCPDTDKDGITDKEDKCPEIAGIAKYAGCPIPDSDKDGINDEVDKCPEVPGVERYEGCPVPDSDKDGMNDEEDKCPAVAGVLDEFGCPPVDYKGNNLNFKLGSSSLSSKSKKELDLLAKFLIQNSEVKVYLSGHSDSTGTELRNTVLSLERAQKAAEYLSANGITAERINAEGFSYLKPIADNRTEKGRMQNRRVEIKLKRY